MSQRVKRILSAAAVIVTAAAASIFTVPSASAQDATQSVGSDFVVKYDQVRLLRLDEPASDVIVGNPSIADVAIQNSKLLVVTGKTFGTTNLIILDQLGRVVMDRRLIVAGNDQKIVSLIRGSTQKTYNCAPKCQPTLKIGDDTVFYQEVAKSAAAKVGFSSGASAAGGGGGE